MTDRWDRPEWVLGLGIYGRAAFEWRRRTTVVDPETLVRLRPELEVLDREVADQVRSAVQEVMNPDEDPSEAGAWDDLPVEVPVTSPEDLVAVTAALEITPCRTRVFQPVSTPGAPLGNGARPSPQHRQLLDSTSWLDRPSLDQLRADAAALAIAIKERGEEPLVLVDEGLVPATLVEPTALFPTELRVAHQILRHRLDRPVDLYLLFD
jgi:hypothetical protein